MTGGESGKVEDGWKAAAGGCIRKREGVELEKRSAKDENTAETFAFK